MDTVIGLVQKIIVRISEHTESVPDLSNCLIGTRAANTERGGFYTQLAVRLVNGGSTEGEGRHRLIGVAGGGGGETGGGGGVGKSSEREV